MRIQRSTLADGGLLLLGVAVAALVVGVLTGTRGGPEASSAPAPAPTTATATATPTAGLSPAATRVDALLLGDATASGLGPAVGQALGWTVTVDAAPGTGFVTGPADQQLQARAAGASAAAPYEVVVVAASTADDTPPDGQIYGGNVAAAVAAVRTALPEAEIVLLGPAGTEPGGLKLQRDLLSAVAARFGAYFVDPVGRQWLVGKPALVAGDVPNDAGYAEMARRLAADLAVTFPATLLPSA